MLGTSHASYVVCLRNVVLSNVSFRVRGGELGGKSPVFFICCFVLVYFPRCQWQVEANGVISPALTPSPSPLPLTIDEDREFTYPSDVLVPPVGHYFDLPRIRLPPGIMIKLREISGRARPQFRPSIK